MSLPEKYQLPIVLGDLEGKTRREAAEKVVRPEGTVVGRLAHARTRLAKGFARRSVVFSGGALAVTHAEKCSVGVCAAVVDDFDDQGPNFFCRGASNICSINLGQSCFSDLAPCQANVKRVWWKCG